MEKELENKENQGNENEEEKLITDIAELEREKERERELERKKALARAKKRKLIPPFVMLLAGAITSITMFMLHYESKDMLVTLLWVLIVFFIAGEVLKTMLDRFEAQIEKERMEKGEVYEKDAEGVHTAVKTDESAQSEDNGGSVQVERADDDEEELIF
ncbi:MAG: hypothetical protein NC314_08470 [Roseburia sp.]|nr:hypothetical protein [Ruminococcus sp.]MCM1155927.1 hypothetical protein [Roseburia sp.]MCM1242860.1 hypothetical protein [Roseburia sp.]